MNKLDLERIMEQEPLLCTTGFGLSNLRQYGLEERRAELAKRRASLLNSVETCHKVSEWLTANIVSRKTINTTATSYSFKHQAEKAIGEYVSNGAFIAAAIHAGFKYKIAPGSQNPNAYFNIKTQKNPLAKALGLC